MNYVGKVGPEERAQQVSYVLRTATEPLGPTEIARRINRAWCVMGEYPQSAPVVVVLRRIGAKNPKPGKYTI